MSYGVHLVHTAAHSHGDRCHVSPAPWNVTGAHSPRTHSRPTSAAALCGFNEAVPVLSDVVQNAREGRAELGTRANAHDFHASDLASVRDCSPAKLVVSGSCSAGDCRLTGCRLSRASPCGEPVQARSAG